MKIIGETDVGGWDEDSIAKKRNVSMRQNGT